MQGSDSAMSTFYPEEGNWQEGKVIEALEEGFCGV